MRFRILGPVEVQVGGQPVPLPAAKPRALLALLLVHRDQPITRDWLMEALWPDQRPASADRVLSHYIWRLRKLLDNNGEDRGGRLLRSVPDGYRFSAAADDVDADLFDQRVLSGHAAADRGDFRTAIEALESALQLWRGPALADARALPVLADAARRLEHRRWDVTELWSDLRLAHGGGDVLPALEQLVAADPYRERAWRALLLALAQAGRRSEALQVYQRMWRIFRDELGIEPGPEVREVHDRLLADDQASGVPVKAVSDAARTVPRQLPATSRHFVDRDVERAALARLVDDVGGVGSVAIGVISGAAGVGKTTLALHFAHRVAAAFPDGQLYVNLRGFDPAGEPLAAADAIHGMLSAFGPGRLPDGLEAQAALYRSTLAGKRVLVLLDNAADADQVRPLLPATPGCLVLVTSRHELAGLVIGEGAQLITLDLFSTEVAGELLARHLGVDRVSKEADATAAIVDRCARLPLALTTVAARAAAHPTFPLGRFATELGEAQAVGGALDALDGGDSATRVRAAFSWSYQRLAAPAARLFRLLAVHPGPDISVPAAASLAGLPAAQVRGLLAELAQLHLISEHVPGRFLFHDLLRAYAHELASTVDSFSAREDASRRAAAHYLHSAITATRMIDAGRSTIDLAELPPGAEPEPVTDHAGALAWYDAEHAVLARTIRLCANSTLAPYAWQLAWALDAYLDRRGRWRDNHAVQQAGLAAARRVGDDDALYRTHAAVARTSTKLAAYDEAHDHLEEALAIARRTEHHGRQGSIHSTFVELYERRGDYQAALRHAFQGLAHMEAFGQPPNVAALLNSVGWCSALVGEYQQALSYCRRAIELLERIGDRYGLAHTWGSVAFAQHQLGQYADAITSYEHAIEMLREVGAVASEGVNLSGLGDTYLALGDVDRARQAWTRGLAVLGDLDDLDEGAAQALRAKLAAHR
jgi:DNA-binding SARP family transcriptional activator